MQEGFMCHIFGASDSIGMNAWKAEAKAKNRKTIIMLKRLNEILIHTHRQLQEESCESNFSLRWREKIKRKRYGVIS